jgi:hypothetical protein
MAGSPIKRQRKLGVRLDDGSVIAFPRLTHPRAGLSHAEWRALRPAEKIERLLNISLDHAAEILSWGPVTDLDAQRLYVWLQVWCVVFMIGVRALLNGKLGREAALERDRERLLEEMGRAFDASEAATARVQARSRKPVSAPKAIAATVDQPRVTRGKIRLAGGGCENLGPLSQTACAF